MYCVHVVRWPLSKMQFFVRYMNNHTTNLQITAMQLFSRRHWCTRSQFFSSILLCMCVWQSFRPVLLSLFTFLFVQLQIWMQKQYFLVWGTQNYVFSSICNSFSFSIRLKSITQYQNQIANCSNSVNNKKTHIGLASIVSDVVPRALCIVIARQLHSELLNGITHAPLSFYDRTPTGRILARFSKDIDVIDRDLPEALILTMYCFFEVIFQLFFRLFWHILHTKNGASIGVKEGHTYSGSKKRIWINWLNSN